MSKPIKILLQTTIAHDENDWHVNRFSLLRDHLEAMHEYGRTCQVTARDRERDAAGDDFVLSTLDESDFDELWLLGVDAGDGLSEKDCVGITAFRRRGGGVLTTRDHMDLGSSMCTLGGIGAAHFFHTQNPDPDESRRHIDDTGTASIHWPNYHSGSNGDYQHVAPVGEVHPLLLRRGDYAAGENSRPNVIEYFPAHPHEGGVGAPPGDTSARVIAAGRSKITARPFNLIVAFETRADDADGHFLGRAIAESSFHHFVDYNWDTTRGCPDFVTEAPGREIAEDPRRLDDIKAYVHNVALWLAPAK